MGFQPHPRFEHCYQDEDLMQQIGRIASRTHPVTMEKVTLSRYRALLQLFTFKDGWPDKFDGWKIISDCGLLQVVWNICIWPQKCEFPNGNVDLLRKYICGFSKWSFFLDVHFFWFQLQLKPWIWPGQWRNCKTKPTNKPIRSNTSVEFHILQTEWYMFFKTNNILGKCLIYMLPYLYILFFGGDELTRPHQKNSKLPGSRNSSMKNSYNCSTKHHG